MKQKILVYTLRAAILQAIIALVISSIPFFYGSTGVLRVILDVVRYYDYASKLMNGLVPYRDYLIEYPVLSLPLFVIPRLFTADIQRYIILFDVEMLAMNAAAVYLVASHVSARNGIERVPARLTWYSLFFLALCPLAMARFDLAPMTVAFAAALWWFSGRNRLGGMTAGIGALVKVFPVAIAFPAVVWELSRRRLSGLRGTMTLTLTIIVGTAGWFAVGGKGLMDFLRYHLDRGLEIASVYSGILIIIGKLTGTEMSHIHDYGSEQLLVPWSAPLASFMPLIQGAFLLLVVRQFRRSKMEEGARYAAAAVLVLMVTGKVLSPQYLIWLVPFMAVVEGRTGAAARPLYLFSCLTTTALNLWGFKELLNFEPWAIGLLNLRNLLLLGLLLLLLFGPATQEEHFENSCGVSTAAS